MTWKLGGYKTGGRGGGEACEVLPLEKKKGGRAEHVLAMLKGGGGDQLMNLSDINEHVMSRLSPSGRTKSLYFGGWIQVGVGGGERLDENPPPPHPPPPPPASLLGGPKTSYRRK